jgi:hypothetical protein
MGLTVGRPADRFRFDARNRPRNRLCVFDHDVVATDPEERP